MDFFFSLFMGARNRSWPGICQAVCARAGLLSNASAGSIYRLARTTERFYFYILWYFHGKSSLNVLPSYA